jgi:hypothetical protein
MVPGRAPTGADTSPQHLADDLNKWHTFGDEIVQAPVSGYQAVIATQRRAESCCDSLLPA